MRKINKDAEPREWTEYTSTPEVDYQAIPELRDSLLKEQGYICAYCMRRIPTRDKNSNETSRIDHILSRAKHPDLQLKYQNMVICCPGAIDNNGFHCDNSKGDEDITINLFNEAFIYTISYSSKDGSIKSSNETYNDQIDGKEKLNLNHPLLKKNRQLIIKELILFLNKKGWKRAEIQKRIKDWDSKDSQGKFKPYCGIVLWYLNKKIAQS